MLRPVSIALTIASVIALTALLLLALVAGELPLSTILLLAGLIFTTGFLAIYIFLKSFVFDPLRNVTLDLRAEGGEGPSGSQKPTAGPVGDIIAAVNLLHREKEREILHMKKLEALRRDFIADVSHELKTPIFAAQGFVHTLLDGAVKDKEVRKKFLKKAAKSLDGLDMLVQDLLTLSHMETGHIRMQFAEIDLYSLTEDVFDQFRGKSNKKEISLRIDGPVRKVLAYADRQRIRQVMTNLVSNAIMHSAEGGEVVVSFSVKKKSVITSVRDFGEGIPADHIHRIFERFYRVDKSRSREKGGTGLGLAIVKHILEGHNTVAEVESTPAQGSTFSFRLPRHNDENDNGKDHQSAAR